MRGEPWGCGCNFMVPFCIIFQYCSSCSAFGLEVPMSRKHLTYDDRLAIQAGLQKGLKIAQIAKNIGKDRAAVGREVKAHRRLVTTSGGSNCIHHKTCTRIPDCRSGCFRGKRQCQNRLWTLPGRMPGVPGGVLFGLREIPLCLQRLRPPAPVPAAPHAL